MLIACDAALSHITEEGCVYYIPAYMRLALHQMVALADPPWEVFGSMVFHLTHNSNYARGRYKRFSDAQIDTVCDFLRLVRAAAGFEGRMTEEALKSYWEMPELRRRTIIYVP